MEPVQFPIAGGPGPVHTPGSGCPSPGKQSESRDWRAGRAHAAQGALRRGAGETAAKGEVPQ